MPFGQTLRGCDGWSITPELPLWVTALGHTPPEVFVPFGHDPRGRDGWSIAPELPLHRGCDDPGSSWVAPRPVWPSSGGEMAWHIVAGPPATILMSPGQARQTIRADHLVVRRPREGYMLACWAACGRTGADKGSPVILHRVCCASYDA